MNFESPSEATFLVQDVWPVLGSAAPERQLEERAVGFS